MTPVLQAVRLTKTYAQGEAAMRAKRLVPDSDIRRSWILFGDPTWRPAAFVAVAAHTLESETGSALPVTRASSWRGSA